MNKRIKRQWLKELRSGEWVQGRGALMNNEDKACCLGVLCDIAVREGVIPPWAHMPGDWAWGISGETCALPQKVVKWAGLQRDNPYAGDVTLMGANDSLGYSFRKIARLIEKFL